MTTIFLAVLAGGAVALIVSKIFRDRKGKGR